MKNLINESGGPGNCVFYLDARGLLAYVNDYCCRDLGYEREELIAHAVIDTDMLPDRNRLATMLEQGIHGKAERFETTVQRKDGSRFSAEICMVNAPYGNRMLLRCDLLVCESESIH